MGSLRDKPRGSKVRRTGTSRGALMTNCALMTNRHLRCFRDNSLSRSRSPQKIAFYPAKDTSHYFPPPSLETRPPCALAWGAPR